MQKSMGLVFLVLWATSCSDVSVYGLDPPLGLPATPSPADLSATVQGSYCASSPETMVFPVKILFIIDDSASMKDSDRAFRRLSAARKLVDTLIPKEGIYFGVENFQNTQPLLLTTNPTFTRDRGKLDAALADSAHAPEGDTPYLGALSLAHTALASDIQADPALAGRTRYVVLCLSDGAPTDDKIPPNEEIQKIVRTIKALENGTSARAGQVTLHTAFVRNPTGDVGNSNSTQLGIELLQKIAQIGEGQFRNFENNEQIDFRAFDVASLTRDFRTYSAVLISNITARLTQSGYQADSDADGLLDSLEKQIGTDPTKRDTDGDGCGDLIEYKYFHWDPLKSGRTSTPRHCDCSDQEIKTDRDGDFLNDCEERLLSLNPANPDSDLSMSGDPAPDNMIDYLEVLYNLGRIKADAGDDYDSDGLTNLNELVLHLDPTWNEGAQMQKDYRYDYTIQPIADAGNKDCYTFTVKNVTLLPTLATDEHRAYENVLLLTFAEGPQDNPYEENAVRVVRLNVLFDPTAATGATVEIRPEQFELLGR